MSGRLLVVGADPHRERAFVEWATAGLRVGLVDGTTTAAYEHLVDAFHPLDVATPDENTIDAVTRLAAGYDGITCLSEGAVRTAATVAARLGLPGVGERAADIGTSKIRQREVAVALGLPGPGFAAVRTPEDLAEFFAEGERDAILKPADASASAGVSRVRSLDEAMRAWPRVRLLSRSGSGIVEEFLPGPEYSVEVVVRDGNAVFAARTDKLCTGSFLEQAHIVSTGGPAPTALVDAIISAWQVRDAVLHLEVKGEGAAATLIEGAVRPGGDFIPELVAAAHGRHLYRDLAALALGRPAPSPAQPRARHAAVRFLVASGRVLRQVAPADLLTGRTRVRMARQLAQPNRTLPPLIANWGRAGYALGWDDNLPLLHEELTAVVRDLADKMGVEEMAHG